MKVKTSGFDKKGNLIKPKNLAASVRLPKKKLYEVDSVEETFQKSGRDTDEGKTDNYLGDRPIGAKFPKVALCENNAHEKALDLHDKIWSNISYPKSEWLVRNGQVVNSGVGFYG